MTDDDIKSRNDVLAPPFTPTSPPLVKVSREITTAAVYISTTTAITVALITGKLSEAMFVALLMALITGHFARSKPEGGLDSQTLVDLLKR